MPSSSLVDHFARPAGDANLFAAVEHLVADPGGFPRARVDMGDVGDMDRCFLVDDAARVAHARLLVPARHVDALHDQPAVLREHLQHLAAAALVAAADDDDVVALLDLELVRHRYSTSGASEAILRNLRARNSRVTGPNTRVPIGSPWRLIKTAALRSKRIALPSVRRIGVAVRTITARCTSPFLTRPRGIASLTETIITSPTDAVRRFDPPSTLMHCTRRAPELSATSRFVCIWIMRRLLRRRLRRRLQRRGRGGVRD